MRMSIPPSSRAAFSSIVRACLETTSESGVSDLETSMTELRCSCCPYGYHLDTDFMKFLDDMYGPNVLRTLKKIERKRNDVRRRLVNEQQVMTHSAVGVVTFLLSSLRQPTACGLE